MRRYEPITTSPTTSLGEGTEERHPAFGTIGAFHSTGGSMTLFGSALESHQSAVTIRITDARRSRSLSQDWIFPGKTICEVTMSPAQWANFISTPNVHSGTPCTLTFVKEGGSGQIPGIAHQETAAKRTKDEIRKALGEVPDMLRRQRAQLLAELAQAKVNQKATARILGAFDGVSDHILDKLPFTAETIHEDLEHAVTAAKTEVEAFVTGAVFRAGIAAIANAPNPTVALFGAEEDQGLSPALFGLSEDEKKGGPSDG